MSICKTCAYHGTKSPKYNGIDPDGVKRKRKNGGICHNPRFYIAMETGNDMEFEEYYTQDVAVTHDHYRSLSEFAFIWTGNDFGCIHWKKSSA